MKRVLRWVVLVTLAMGLGGCSEAIDVWVANPCGEPVRVETFDFPPDETDGVRPTARATVAPGVVTRIRDAFADVGEQRWTLKAGPSTFEVRKSDLEHDTFVLPSSACGAAPSS